MPTHLDVEHPSTQTTRGRAVTTLAGLGGQGLIRAMTNVAIGRFAGAAVLGQVSSMIATAQFMFTLWPATGGAGASKYMARARGRGDVHEAVLVARHIIVRVITTASCLAVVAAATWVSIDKNATLLGAMAVGLLVLGLSAQATARGLHYGASQVARGTALDLSTTVAGLIGLIILLLMGVRGPVVVLPLAVGGLAFGLLSIPKGPKGTLDTRVRRDIDIFVTLAAIGSVFSAGLVQLSLIAAKATGGNVGAGHYAAALTLATPLLLASSALGTVLLPSMSEAVGRRDLMSVRAQTDRALRVLALILTPACAALATLSGPIITLIWGEGFAEAAHILPWLSLSMLSVALAVPAVNSLTTQSQRGTMYAALVPAITACAGALVWLATKQSLSTESVALGYFASTTLTAIVLIFLSWTRDGQAWQSIATRLAISYTLVVGTSLLLRVHDSLNGALLGTAGVLIVTIGLAARDQVAWASVRKLLTSGP